MNTDAARSQTKAAEKALESRANGIASVGVESLKPLAIIGSKTQSPKSTVAPKTDQSAAAHGDASSSQLVSAFAENRSPQHPSCSLFPAMTEEEIRILSADIATRGQLNPITRYEGVILDGRALEAACIQAKVKPRYTEWRGPGSIVEFVIAQN